MPAPVWMLLMFLFISYGQSLFFCFLSGVGRERQFGWYIEQSRKVGSGSLTNLPFFFWANVMLSLSICSLNGLRQQWVTNVVSNRGFWAPGVVNRKRHSFNHLAVVYCWEKSNYSLFFIWLCTMNESVGDAVTGILFPQNTSNHSWRPWCNVKCRDQAARGWQAGRQGGWLCLNRAFQHAHNSATRQVDCTGHRRSRFDMLEINNCNWLPLPLVVRTKMHSYYYHDATFWYFLT